MREISPGDLLARRLSMGTPVLLGELDDEHDDLDIMQHQAEELSSIALNRPSK